MSSPRRGAVALALLAVLAAGACSSSKDAPSGDPSSRSTVFTAAADEPKPFGDEQTAQPEFGSESALVNVFLLEPTPNVSPEADKPKGAYYSISVKYTGLSGAFPANPLAWAARTDTSQQLEAAAASDDEIPATDVRPGQSVTGLVSFDVPAGQKITTILLNDPLGDQLLSWTAD